MPRNRKGKMIRACRIGRIGILSLLLLVSSPLASCSNESTSVEDNRLTYDLSGVSFSDADFVYDGEEHSLSVEGSLPNGVRVSYSGNGKKDVGTYEVRAHFEGDDTQYQPLEDKIAYLTITPCPLFSLDFPSMEVEYNGQFQSLTLASSLPDGVEVSYQGGGVDVGNYPITAYLLDTTGNYQLPSSLTATLVITKKKVEPPKVRTSSFTYDGEEQKVVLDGFDSGIMTLSGDRKAVEIGRYSLQVSLKDEKNYQWSDPAFDGILSWEIIDRFDQVSFLVIDDKALILGLIPNQQVTILRIPDTVYSCGVAYPVTGINSDAFYQNTTIEEVYLPNSLETIEDRAFMGCTSLRKVSFGNSLKTIGGNCFNGDTSLEELTLPYGVTELGWCSFFHCGNLTSVSFPETLKKVGARSFAGCDSIVSFEVSSIDGLAKIAFGSDDANPLYFSHQLTCLGSVVSDLSSLTLDSISSYAFAGWQVTSLTFPSTLCSVSGGAFQECTSLTEIRIDSLSSFSRISFGDQYANPLTYAHVLKQNGVALDSLTLDSSITEIARYAFTGWDIQNLVIPDTVVRLGFGCFSHCSSLSSVSGGALLEEIGDQSFSYDDALTSYVCPPLLKTISQRAFFHCDGLLSITFDSLLTKIGDSAFARDISLASLVFPSSLVSIGDGCFSQCTSLASVTFDDSLRYVGNGAFDGCDNLTSLIVSDPYLLNLIQFQTDEGISNPLGYGASLYQGSTEITSLDFSSVTGMISDGAYDGMAHLTSVTFGDGVTGVGTYSFRRTGLTSLNISSSMTTLGKGAFYECTSLVSCQGEEGLLRIEESCFEGCQELSSFSFPDSLKTISKQAFYCCPKLSEVTLGNQVTSLGEASFGFCDNLKKVSLPDSLLSVSSKTFEYDGKLSEVDLGEGIRHLGNQAFLECDHLTSLSLPKSITSIGAGVFSGCRLLFSVSYQGTQNEFLQIQKDADWKEGSSLDSVICQDGTLLLS